MIHQVLPQLVEKLISQDLMQGYHVCFHYKKSYVKKLVISRSYVNNLWVYACCCHASFPGNSLGLVEHVFVGQMYL